MRNVVHAASVEIKVLCEKSIFWIEPERGGKGRYFVYVHKSDSIEAETSSWQPAFANPAARREINSVIMHIELEEWRIGKGDRRYFQLFDYQFKNFDWKSR